MPGRGGCLGNVQTLPSTKCSNRNVTLKNKFLPVARKGKNISVLHLLPGITTAHLGSVPFFAWRLNLLKLEKGLCEIKIFTAYFL